MPITYAVFVIGALSAGDSLGFPVSSARNEIIWSAYAAHTPVELLSGFLHLRVHFYAILHVQTDIPHLPRKKPCVHHEEHGHVLTMENTIFMNHQRL